MSQPCQVILTCSAFVWLFSSLFVFFSSTWKRQAIITHNPRFSSVSVTKIQSSIFVHCMKLTSADDFSMTSEVNNSAVIAFTCNNKNTIHYTIFTILSPTGRRLRNVLTCLYVAITITCSSVCSKCICASRGDIFHSVINLSILFSTNTGLMFSSQAWRSTACVWKWKEIFCLCLGFHIKFVSKH